MRDKKGKEGYTTPPSVKKGALPPPYDMEEEKFVKLIDLVFNRDLLNEDGVLIIEHGKNTDLSKHKRLTRQRKYGSNIFSFFDRED